MCSAPLTELRALWSPAGRGVRRVDPDQTVLSTWLVKLALSGACSYGKPEGDCWATPLPHHIILCSQELTVVPSDWRKKGSCSLCSSPHRPRYGSQVTTSPYTVTSYDGRAKRTRAALQQLCTCVTVDPQGDSAEFTPEVGPCLKRFEFCLQICHWPEQKSFSIAKMRQNHSLFKVLKWRAPLCLNTVKYHNYTEQPCLLQPPPCKKLSNMTQPSKALMCMLWPTRTIPMLEVQHIIK